MNHVEGEFLQYFASDQEVPCLTTNVNRMLLRYQVSWLSSGISQTTMRFSFALSMLCRVLEGLGLFSGTFHSLKIGLSGIYFSCRTFTVDRLPLFCSIHYALTNSAQSTQN